MNTHLSFSLQPSGLQTVSAFEVVWKKEGRKKGGMEGEVRDGRGREGWKGKEGGKHFTLLVTIVHAIIILAWTCFLVNTKVLHAWLC